MIDFLESCDISKETINNIKKNNSNYLLCDLSCNVDSCKRIIIYMKDIGIKVIDELLINYLDVFLLSISEFIELIKKKEIESFVQSVNDDYNNIKDLCA